MSQTIHYYTPEGFQKAKKTLQELKTKDRIHIRKEIEEARSKGDLSENAEYHAAKEAQELLERKITTLELQLINARLIDPKKRDNTKVSILSTVKLKNVANNMTTSYTLVPPTEANFKQGKISTQSPIGNGLLGKKVGDIAVIDVPAGKINFEILAIS